MCEDCKKCDGECKDAINEDGLITLISETGEEVEFAIVGVVEHEGEEYFIVTEKEALETENPDVTILLRLKEEEEAAAFEAVEDEVLGQAIIDKLNDAMKQQMLEEASGKEVIDNP